MLEAKACGATQKIIQILLTRDDTKTIQKQECKIKDDSINDETSGHAAHSPYITLFHKHFRSYRDMFDFLYVTYIQLHVGNMKSVSKLHLLTSL